MTTYIPYRINLSESQKENLKKAIQAKGPIKLRLHFSQFQNGPHTLSLTKTQIEKIKKRLAESKGADITLSASQVVKQGGFLGNLLLNTAKNIIPTIGISALEGLTSALVNKIISGSGCDYIDFTEQALPHLLKSFPKEERKAIKEGGFVVPLLATLASTLVPTLINLMSGRGYQVRPFEGEGYQIRPPKNYLITP